MPSVLGVRTVGSTVWSKSGVLARWLRNIAESTTILRSGTAILWNGVAILWRRSAIDLCIVVLLCVAVGVVWYGLELRWWWATRKTVVAMSGWCKWHARTDTLRTKATGECDLGSVLVAAEGNKVLATQAKVSYVEYQK